MTNTLGIYNYSGAFYTGTNQQPDVITLFVKAEPGENSYKVKHLNSSANWMGCIPILSTFTGIIRIVSAVKKIFEEISQSSWNTDDTHMQEAWNGVKNLFRGLVEIVPLIGNAALILYDGLRAAIYFNNPIPSPNDRNIVGVSFDGKIIFKVPLDRLDRIFNQPPNDVAHQLARFEELFHMFLRRNEEVQRPNPDGELPPLNMLAHQLGNFLENGPPP